MTTDIDAVHRRGDRAADQAVDPLLFEVDLPQLGVSQPPGELPQPAQVLGWPLERRPDHRRDDSLRPLAGAREAG